MMRGKVNCNSERSVSRTSALCLPSVLSSVFRVALASGTAAPGAGLPSAVVPLLPLEGCGRDAGAGWVAAEPEGDHAAEDVGAVECVEEVADGADGDGPGERFDKEPQVRQRLRTFHAV